MFKKLINLFKKKEVEIKEPIHGADDVNFVFDVENFNEWFCDPNNGAVYANKGIFLRIDILSHSHIKEYLLNRFNLVSVEKFESDADKLISYFYNEIRTDWMKKSHENAM